MLIAMQGHEYLIHQDLALVIQRLFEVCDPQCMLDIVIGADAVNFHGVSPPKCAAWLDGGRPSIYLVYAI